LIRVSEARLKAWQLRTSLMEYKRGAGFAPAPLDGPVVERILSEER
jgi:hypothetical protein